MRTAQLIAEEAQGVINGEAYNFGPPTDQNYTVLDLLKQLAVTWDETNQDILQIEASAFPESGLLKLNIDKALFDLQWNPTLSFEQTAEFTGEWYKQYYTKKDVDIYSFTMEQIRQYIDIATQKSLPWIQD